ncbi:MAG TPA: alpha/beta fold hydrolase [Stellaceae bacterium]|nr:alpha/beta fold hydrolase [Stellaceae bacterium]
MDLPETRYAKSGDVHIAYQVVGNGPLDVVWVPGAASNIELLWEFPEFARFCTRLASFCRLISFDKRGTGMSDRAAGIASLEDRMDDVRAVMEAAGSSRAAVLGQSEGGPMSLLFAATYPERTSALILFGAFSNSIMKDWPPERWQARLDEFERNYGTGAHLRFMAPSKLTDEAFVRTWRRYERQCASPAAFIALQRMNRDIDVRHVLSAIRVPTLVMHRTGDPTTHVDRGRSLAAQIPGARFLELPGLDHLPWAGGDTDRIVDEIEEFLTGSRHEVELDRVLATVLFTDIVDSTRHAVELGDRQWRSLLDRHDRAVREQFARFHGREVKHLGDGFLATFDGPARAVRCAAAITQTMEPLDITVRSGLHTGEIELKRDDIGGIAVNIAARVAAMAQPGESLVSSTVRDLVAGSGLRFADRGFHALRGLPEQVHLYTVLPEG